MWYGFDKFNFDILHPRSSFWHSSIFVETSKLCLEKGYSITLTFYHWFWYALLERLSCIAVDSWLFSEAPSCWLLIRHGRRPRFKHSLWWFQRQWQETSERVAQTTYSWIAAHSCKSGSQRTVSIWAKRTNIPCLQRITFELEHLGVSPQKCFLSLLDLPFPSASGHLLCLHQRMNLLCLRLWHSLVRSRQRPESITKVTRKHKLTTEQVDLLSSQRCRQWRWPNNFIALTLWHVSLLASHLNSKVQKLLCCAPGWLRDSRICRPLTGIYQDSAPGTASERLQRHSSKGHKWCHRSHRSHRPRSDSVLSCFRKSWQHWSRLGHQRIHWRTIARKRPHKQTTTTSQCGIPPGQAQNKKWHPNTQSVKLL